MHAVELRSCHVYAAHDQRRTHVALVPLRGVTVFSYELGTKTPPRAPPLPAVWRVRTVARLLSGRPLPVYPDLAAPPSPVPTPQLRPPRNDPSPGSFSSAPAPEERLAQNAGDCSYAGLSAGRQCV